MRPGEAIKDELDRRGWTQADLARILNRPLPTINEIIVGKKSITPEMAVALASAFGTEASYWMNLEVQYRLSLVETNNEPARRARLYACAPVKEMERRGWIPKTGTADDLERELCRFLEVPSLDQEPVIGAATRKTDRADAMTPSQRAWCFRAKHLAHTVQATAFTDESLPAARVALRALAGFPEEARHVPKVMAEHGIRFVVVEPLQGTKIDGAAIWIDESSPAIAVSIRYDRIDAFWHTVFHEMSHIEHRDGTALDTSLIGEDSTPVVVRDATERRADEEAADTLIPTNMLQSFILRVGPLYAKTRIVQFAHRAKVHPGIVVGQLQHRGEIGYSANREMLTNAKVREIVTTTALTDGWGRVVQGV